MKAVQNKKKTSDKKNYIKIQYNFNKNKLKNKNKKIVIKTNILK